MKSGFRGVSLPPGTPLPANEFFHVNTFAGGYDSRDAQEDLPPGSSPSMLDMEVSQDDRLIRAPGVTQTEILAHTPTQVILQPGFKYASEMLLLKAPYIGVKTTGPTVWTDVGLRQGVQGYTNFAGVALLSNGVGGIYSRQPKATKIEKIPEAPSAFGLTVFADRVVLGGTRVSDSMDFMGIGWSDATSDYKGWDIAQGAGAETMIGSQHTADRFQAFAPNGFNTLAILNRRSIWIATPTGDVFEPMNIVPRLEDTGCVSAATVVPTEYGTLFLSDDGVRLFTGNDVPIVSAQINSDLAISETLKYSASFDPTRKRYYLHTPTETWVFDMVRRRWFRWAGVFTASLFFPAQGARGTRWSEAQGTWGMQTKAWWQFLNYESGGSMQFVKDSSFGQEDTASSSVFGVPLTPQWFDRRVVGDNQDMLMTAVNTRFTYEAAAPAQIQVWLPDKPDGNPEPVATGTLAPGSATKRTQIPLIHTGRAISLGLKILSGSPRIRKAAVEYQQTGMLWEGDTLEAITVSTDRISDAILRPRLVYTNGYDTGQQQSFQRELITGGVAGRIGDLNESLGWAYIPTGGENGGGYVKSIANVTNPTLGQYSLLPMFTTANNEFSFPNVVLGEPDSHVSKAGKGVRFNLFGKVLTQPMNCMAMIGSGVFVTPQVVLQIMPNLTIRAVRVENNNGAGIFTIVPIGVPSEFKVPATGWFKLDWQVCISKFGNDESGFVLVRMYRLGESANGTKMLSLTGVKTCSSTSFDTINGWSWGTEVIVGAGPGLDDIGVDDVNTYLDYGNVKGFMGNIYIDKTIPVADGDTVQSETVHDGTHTRAEIGASSPGPGDPVGAIITHGQAARYKNLSGVLTSLDSKADNNLGEVFNLGTISVFTGNILDTDVPNTPFVRSGVDGLVYNTLYDGMLDLYRMAAPRSDAAIIVGITPLYLMGNRTILFRTLGDAGWNGAAQHPTLVESAGLEAERDRNHIGESIVKLGGVIRSVRSDFTHSTLGGWGSMVGYTRNPFSTLEVKGDGITRFTQADLAAIQVGLRVSTFFIDHAPDPSIYLLFNQVMLAQVLLEYAYLLVASDLEEHAAPAPITKLVQTSGTNLVTGHLAVRDATASWGDPIVSRLVDWNDGSGPEAIEGSVSLDPADSTIWPFLQHTYALSGTYNIKLTTQDSGGLVSTDTLTITIPDHVPSGNFSQTGIGLAITFTDSSVGVLATIVSWLWFFGDGSSSTAQNPVHTYLAAGVYTVTLMVTDSNGNTSSVSVSLTVPIPVASGCGFSDDPVGDEPFVMGDDFAGGNPPLPAYADVAAFRTYYWGDNFRAWYGNGYSGDDTGVEYDLVSDVMYNGHKTLRMSFGVNPLPPARSLTTGAGWSSGLTDDDPISENYFETAPFGKEKVWFRQRMRWEAGIMSDASVLEANRFDGLELFSFGDNLFFGVFIRAGRLKLDINYLATANTFIHTGVTFDLGPETDFFADRVSGMGELIMLLEGDLATSSARFRVWVGNNCTLAGTEPLVDEVLPAHTSADAAHGGSDFGSSRGLSSDSLSHYNWIFTPAANPNKNLWHADAKVVPADIYPDPFGIL